MLLRKLEHSKFSETAPCLSASFSFLPAHREALVSVGLFDEEDGALEGVKAAAVAHALDNTVVVLAALLASGKCLVAVLRGRAFRLGFRRARVRCAPGGAQGEGEEGAGRKGVRGALFSEFE